MGSYLSKPVTEKVSTNDSSDKLSCGASSMQGWRVSQEDAHNCILDFDTNTSLFAVYDGHGGHEVALYSSQKFPEFLKKVDAYKNGDMTEALIDAFLGFDNTIATSEVVEVLKELATDKTVADDSDEEDDVNNLYEEANMPIELVIEKYTSNLKNSNVKTIQKENVKKPTSPCLKARMTKTEKPGTSNVQNECSSSTSGGISVSNAEVNINDNTKENVSSSICEEKKLITPNKPETHENNVPNGVTDVGETKVETPDSTNDAKDEATTDKNKESDHKDDQSDQTDKIEKADHIKEKDNNTEESAKKCEKSDQKSEESDHKNHNGDVPQPDDKTVKENVTLTEENGEVTNKGKGKAIAKTKGVKAPKDVGLRRSARQLYSCILNIEDDSEDDDDEEDEEDKTFIGPNDQSSDDEDEDENQLEDSSEDVEEEDEDEEDDDGADDEYSFDDDEEDELDSKGMEFAKNMKEEPGSDSGCTAVVALLKENEIYVANAGDSRCVVCRNGEAIEMSFDHKPEDDPERNRVLKAGGVVTADGRVNGGLNLSRAFGDHGYKQNKELSNREQMITALPDVRTLTLNPSDEFMVLACDGIWNFMSSQEVVDFVRPRIKERENLSQICEDMFDHCLAPNTIGDGTGCDNMTAIIVQFKSNILKRSATDSTDGAAKRIKLNENDNKDEVKVEEEEESVGTTV